MTIEMQHLAKARIVRAFYSTGRSVGFFASNSLMMGNAPLLMLVIFGSLDLAAVGGILALSITSGVSPDALGFRRDKEPKGFWLSVGTVVLLGAGILAVIAGGLL